LFQERLARRTPLDVSRQGGVLRRVQSLGEELLKLRPRRTGLRHEPSPSSRAISSRNMACTPVLALKVAATDRGSGAATGPVRLQLV
jgi:hypothetical protein